MSASCETAVGRRSRARDAHGWSSERRRGGSAVTAAVALQPIEIRGVIRVIMKDRGTPVAADNHMRERPSELNARFASHAAEHTRKPATSQYSCLTPLLLQERSEPPRETTTGGRRTPRVSQRPRALRAPAQPETALALLPTNRLATLTRSVHLRVNPHNGPQTSGVRGTNDVCGWVKRRGVIA